MAETLQEVQVREIKVFTSELVLYKKIVQRMSIFGKSTECINPKQNEEISTEIHQTSDLDPKCLRKEISNLRGKTLSVLCLKWQVMSLHEKIQERKRVYSLLPFVINVLTFQNFDISRKEFRDIIFMAQNCKTVEFRSCKIDSSEIQFRTGVLYRIQELKFNFCGSKSNSNWVENPDKINSIIKAISGCSLNTSLKLLNLHGFCFEGSEAYKLMIEYDLGHIMVFAGKCYNIRPNPSSLKESFEEPESHFENCIIQ
ncbi:unnamed protein product [Moneuplotes crassus]|uniref:Uncharacterized protein n=1 Tax=Euplotes crassus TaxID=5936 RepID=A0AAD1XRI5_EUPCR|nr:unnamed protein product [Moneuplotes crassus]